jgi:hypothetical protein
MTKTIVGIGATMTKPCNACLAQHDEEIHAATNRVHGWFRAQVTKHLHDAVELPGEGEQHEAQQLNAA